MALTTSRRLAVSLGSVAAMGALARVDASPRSLLVGEAAAQQPPGVSWLGLGVAPLVTAFVLVELVALAVPALRWRRVSGAGPRRPLSLASWALGGVLALVQGFSIVRYAEDATLLLPLLGGTALAWALVAVNDRFGLVVASRSPPSPRSTGSNRLSTSGARRRWSSSPPERCCSPSSRPRGAPRRWWR